MSYYIFNIITNYKRLLIDEEGCVKELFTAYAENYEDLTCKKKELIQ